MKKTLTSLLLLGSFIGPRGAAGMVNIPNCLDDDSTPLCFRDIEVSQPTTPSYFDRDSIFVYDKYGYVKCDNGTPVTKKISRPDQLVRVPTGKLKRDSEGNLIGGRSINGPARQMKLVRADQYFDQLDMWEENLAEKGLTINGLTPRQIDIAKFRANRRGQVADESNAVCFLRHVDLSYESYTIADSEIRGDIFDSMVQADREIFDSYYQEGTREFDDAITMQNKSLGFLVNSSTGVSVDMEKEILNLDDKDLTLTEKRAFGEVMVDFDEVDQRELDSLNLFDSIRGPLGDTSPTLGRNSYDNGEEWGVLFGNKDIFGAEAYIETNQYSDKGFDLESENIMGANVYVFGLPLNLATARSFSFTDFNYKEVETYLSVAGRDINQFNGIKSGNTAKIINSNASETVQKDVSISFSLGPIPVTATTGARGTVAMSSSAHAMKVKVMSSLTPSVSVVGFAELAVDVFVARAGVGGELRIIRDDISAVSELGIKTRPRTGAIAFYSEMSAINTLRTLDGRLYAFAELSNPFGRNPRYEHNIFRWGGATHSGALYSTSEYVDLFY